MIECSLFALVESVQDFKEHLGDLGCVCTSYIDEHNVYVHEEKHNLKCRAIKETSGSESIVYISPPDSNASRTSIVQNVERSQVQKGNASILLKTAGYVQQKQFSVHGFRCSLEKANVDCFQLNDVWVAKLYFSTESGKQVEDLEQRLPLFASRYFPSCTFYDSKSLPIHLF